MNSAPQSTDHRPPIDPADNISAGTQIVALVEIRGPNNSLVHPRGAVGVITRTPAGTEQHFLVRFPDGFSASLTRDQLDVLKHFKGRPDNPAPGPGFDLESTVIYRCTVGSRAYGLDIEASVTSLKGLGHGHTTMVVGSEDFFDDVVKSVESKANTEQRRLSYVALTRAKHLLVVATPSAHYARKKDFWVSRHFRSGN